MSRLIALAVLAAIVLAAPAAAVSWRLSDGLRRDLQARSAAVYVYAGPTGIATGRIRRLVFRVRGAALDGATVRELRGDLRGVRLSLPRAVGGRLAVRGVAAGRAEVVVDETDVQRALADAREIRRARVRLDDGVVAISGDVYVLNAPVAVEVTARLAVDHNRDLVLRVQTLHLSGLAIPPDLANALMVAVNPLLRAPQEPVPIRFVGVEVDDGRAVIRGVPSP
ncbi:MAG: DUF2993 domain-containing protein [Armatimonadota bacterium]|nr:DUF2993 domain-containing protein [Armatimonadota bacterium]MDR7451292.1 DUF2993 domain-containing protein [Armatimonadota bacterium]MDR7466805.1 DUF2993 domain-containing protein [Armatimonadota bacterium]MDR7492722.1 DUF2993 domain-containing protein [Armatimonadota bacterium]MDR7499651.1 DUF2993 domain-containing protein [Armatimonadota bacterium]